MAVIIVDVEGVVRDSRSAFHHAYEQALAKVGLKLNATPAETWALRGFAQFNTADKTLRALYAIAAHKENLTAVFWKKYPVKYVEELIAAHNPSKRVIEKLIRSYNEFLSSPLVLRRIPPVRAGKKAIRLLRAAGHKVVGHTNGSITLLKPWLAARGVNIDVWGIEQSGAPKPAPDGIVKVCKAIGVKPRHAIYVGDSEADALAARAARCEFVGIRSGATQRKILKALGATYVFDDLMDFARWIRSTARANGGAEKNRKL